MIQVTILSIRLIKTLTLGSIRKFPWKTGNGKVKFSEMRYSSVNTNQNPLVEIYEVLQDDSEHFAKFHVSIGPSSFVKS